MKRRSLLARLRSNGVSYLIGALLLLVGVPLYQALVLNPSGYNTALNALGSGQSPAYLGWIATHGVRFLLYRVLLILPFALLLSLPFALFRIIVAQELMRQMEQGEQDNEEVQQEEVDADGLPAYSWRGKGFAIIAAWAGIAGLVLYLLGTAANLGYLLIASQDFNTSHTVAASFALLSSIFSIIVNTAGIGLLGLSTLFFGAMIARSGRALWPGVWLAFGYAALGVAALLSGSAVGVASAPLTGQAALTTPAILLFGLWVLWLAIMLVRLKAEEPRA